jgi:hypothetical protein
MVPVSVPEPHVEVEAFQSVKPVITPFTGTIAFAQLYGATPVEEVPPGE